MRPFSMEGKFMTSGMRKLEEEKMSTERFHVVALRQLTLSSERDALPERSHLHFIRQIRLS